VRVAEAIGRALAQLGVRDFFGLVGSGNFHLTNALQASGARFVAARHETGAVTMADAYARASGRLGVCTVHQGPGVTNALTGLTESAKSRTPLLLLAAEATSPHSNFFIDDRGLRGRPWYKHEIYAPGIFTGYASQPLTDFRQAIDDRNLTAEKEGLERIIAAINRASEVLKRGRE